mmetsp:Transcript_52888/g.123593  ORF Transcript_52888/g.123593 Transcript_52888/m.123593 type:complete len:314 (+) Transcript_52888:239-1180(+)
MQKATSLAIHGGSLDPLKSLPIERARPSPRTVAVPSHRPSTNTEIMPASLSHEAATWCHVVSSTRVRPTLVCPAGNQTVTTGLEHRGATSSKPFVSPRLENMRAPGCGPAFIHAAIVNLPVRRHASNAGDGSRTTRPNPLRCSAPSETVPLPSSKPLEPPTLSITTPPSARSMCHSATGRRSGDTGCGARPTTVSTCFWDSGTDVAEVPLPPLRSVMSASKESATSSNAPSSVNLVLYSCPPRAIPTGPFQVVGSRTPSSIGTGIICLIPFSRTACWNSNLQLSSSRSPATLATYRRVIHTTTTAESSIPRHI